MKMSSLAIAILAFAGFTPAARTEPLWPVDQTFNVSLGVFFLDTDTTVRLDGESGRVGTEVNFEDDLGLTSQDRFRIDGYWRFFERHKLRFMYFDSSSSSSRSIDEEIDFGDTTFPIDIEVRGDLDTQILEVAYEYSFLKRDTYEVSGTIGLHNLRVEARLRATGSGGGGTGGVELSERANGDGPLPVIGLRGIWALSNHFYFDAQAQFFAVEIDDYDGSLEDYKLTFTWQPLRNLGVGIGYNSFVSRLDVNRTGFNGKLRFEYGGPMLFVTGAF